MRSATRIPTVKSRDDRDDLRAIQLTWLAAAVFVVSAGYGALLPLLPGWPVPIRSRRAIASGAD